MTKFHNTTKQLDSDCQLSVRKDNTKEIAYSKNNEHAIDDAEGDIDETDYHEFCAEIAADRIPEPEINEDLAWVEAANTQEVMQAQFISYVASGKQAETQEVIRASIRSYSDACAQLTEARIQERAEEARARYEWQIQVMRQHMDDPENKSQIGMFPSREHNERWTQYNAEIDAVKAAKQQVEEAALKIKAAQEYKDALDAIRVRRGQAAIERNSHGSKASKGNPIVTAFVNRTRRPCKKTEEAKVAPVIPVVPVERMMMAPHVPESSYVPVPHSVCLQSMSAEMVKQGEKAIVVKGESSKQVPVPVVKADKVVKVSKKECLLVPTPVQTKKAEEPQVVEDNEGWDVVTKACLKPAAKPVLLSVTKPAIKVEQAQSAQSILDTIGCESFDVEKAAARVAAGPSRMCNYGPRCRAGSRCFFAHHEFEIKCQYGVKCLMVECLEETILGAVYLDRPTRSGKICHRAHSGEQMDAFCARTGFAPPPCKASKVPAKIPQVVVQAVVAPISTPVSRPPTRFCRSFMAGHACGNKHCAFAHSESQIVNCKYARCSRDDCHRFHPSFETADSFTRRVCG